jgi:ribonuclease VapC
LIVDTSAFVAILLEEPGWERLRDALNREPPPRMAAPTLLELRTVVAGRRNDTLLTGLDALLNRFRIEIVPFTDDHAAIAYDAYLRYGKGFHSRARLNLGDCFSYAIAKATGEPLLFVGDDFMHTDIVPALTT